MKGAIHMFKKFKRRGQVLVFYALLIPLLFMFAGVGLDLGWYYLNVSRLQNAADAAVVAGAQKLITTEDFSSYEYKGLVDKYSGTRDEDKDTKAGDEEAQKYAVKNLGFTQDVDFGTAEEPDIKTFIIDNWSKGGDPKVEPEYWLYKDDDKYYYIVKLTESIQHFFPIPNFAQQIYLPIYTSQLKCPCRREVLAPNLYRGHEELKAHFL